MYNLKYPIELNLPTNKRRMLIISDVHGYYDEFVRLLEVAGYQKSKDLLVLAGDFIDRGPKSIEMINFCIKNHKEMIVLTGNHEKMFVEYNFGELSLQDYYFNGGNSTMEQIQKLNLQEKHIMTIAKYLSSLKKYHRQGNVLITHSGYNRELPIEHKNQDTLWQREDFFTKPGYDNVITVFGHTPTRFINKTHGIWFDKLHCDKFCIDCGASIDKTIGCLEFSIEEKVEINSYYINRK